MPSIETAITFFGWALLLSVIAIVVVAAVIMLFKDGLARVQVKMFGVTEAEAKSTVFLLFHLMRVIVIFFVAIPYFVLLIMR